MNWNDYKARNGFTLFNDVHASNDDWDDYEAVNDPASGKKLPNEGHASDDDWDDYEAVNDPASGKKLPNEGHASDDDWDDYEAVNDPASGKKLPNEGHASLTVWLKDNLGTPSVPTSQPIYVTETFVKNITEIYGDFTHNDDEYPTMGITIQGTPVFVECVRFPDCAVIRRRYSDEVKREHPAVGALWQEKLRQYEGKCRTSTVHPHPMNLPFLSGTDIANFDSLRLNPDDPSTFDGEHPYPVILINITAAGKLEMLGFWVTDGRAYKVDVKPVRDDSQLVKQAWQRAEKMPFFTEEAEMARRINRCVSKEWEIVLGVNRRTGGKAIKAVRSDGKKVLVRFNSETPLGLSVGGAAPHGFCFETYFDWTRMFNDLADREEQNSAPAEVDTGKISSDQGSSLSGTAGDKTSSTGVVNMKDTQDEKKVGLSTDNASPNELKHSVSRYSATA